MFKVSPEDDYSIRLFSKMLEYGISEMEQFKRLPELPPADQDAVLLHLGELAFSCQQASNLMLGKEALVEVEKKWLLERLDSFLENFLGRDDYWEYAQIAYFLERFDKDASLRFLRKCGEHPDPEIRELAGYE
ncbi:MAG: hypothetical protein EOP88_15155 [Verrucomicrobiaceae bacterium]|nr:MAG: hypothetical protein EOP88_15155 [Verrucomicrobiaceae bacterium]